MPPLPGTPPLPGAVAPIDAVSIDAGGPVERVARPIASLAEECRQAYQGFLFGVASGWREDDLATFLATTYGDVAIDGAAESDALARRPFGADAQVDPAEATDLLQATRRDVLETLEYIGTVDGGRPFAFRAITSGWVARAEDATGAAGWVPVASPSMRLKARILSLVAADYLMRQEDYLTSLTICTRCERVVFDAAVRERGACCRVSTSGMWLPSSPAPGAPSSSRAPDPGRTPS